MSIIKQRKFVLDEKQIDNISEEVTEFIRNFKIERKNALRIRLTLEELLIRVINQGSNPINCELVLEKRFGIGYIKVYYDGVQYNPIVDEENSDELLNQMLVNMGLSPTWDYKENKNKISLSVKKPKKSSIFYILSAIVLSIVLGIFGQFIPIEIKEGLGQFALNPVGDAFLGLLNTFTGILIFVSIVCGINSMGDSRFFGKTAKKMIMRFLLLMFIIVTIWAIILIPFFNLNWANQAGDGDSQFSKVSEMIWKMLPNNIIEPFAEGNNIQIMILALFFGSAILVLKEQSEGISKIFDQLNSVVIFILEKICVFIPLFVFTTLLNQFWFGTNNQMFDIWKPILALAIISFLTIGVILIYTSVRTKYSPIKLLKTMFSPWLIALTTASTLSAYSANLSVLEDKFKIPKKISRAGLPLANQLYSAGDGMYYIVMVLFLAGIYSVPVDITWIIIAVFLICIISIATPPVPGANILCFSIIGAQLGIPEVALVIVATIDFMMDSIATSSNTVLRDLELLLQSGKINEESNVI